MAKKAFTVAAPKVSKSPTKAASKRGATSSSTKTKRKAPAKPAKPVKAKAVGRPKKKQSQEDDSDTEYKIDCIVEQAGSGKAAKYKVLWLGYAAREATWESRKNLDATQALDVWEKKQRKLVKKSKA